METATESGKIAGEEELVGIWNIEFRWRGVIIAYNNGCGV